MKPTCKLIEIQNSFFSHASKSFLQIASFVQEIVAY